MSIQMEFHVGKDDVEHAVTGHTLYSDIVGMPNPMYLGVCVRIFNYDASPLYMQLDAYVSGVLWTFTTNNVGSVGAGANIYYFKDQFGYRTIPTVETDETITMRLRAYTDAGYTNLVYTYERTVYVFFIKSDDGSWTTDFDDDFDDGTVDGWAARGLGGYVHPFEVVGDFVLSAPYSIRYSCDHTSGVADWYGELYKTFTTPNTTKVYAIIHLRTLGGENYANRAFEIRVAGIRYIYCGGPTPNSKWVRFVVLLPVNSTIEISIGRRYTNVGLETTRMWTDDFKIISK